MANHRGWGSVLAGLVVSCSGVEGPPRDGTASASGGSTSYHLHAGASCGGVATAGAGTGGGGSSPLPSDFDAGASETGGSAGAPQGGQGARAFVFSEYVEGSSTHKALEITAIEGGSLDGCRILSYFNGGTTPAATELEGSLHSGAQYVVCSSSLAEMGATCDRTAGLTFNGDDAIVLECDGAIVDVIGQIGFDPGIAWGGGDVSLADRTLRRRCGISSGDSDPGDAFDPGREWWGFPQDSFDDLGARSCDDGGSSGSGQGGAGGAGEPPARAFIFSEYVEGSSTYKALEIAALEDSSFDGCRIGVYFNGSTTASGTALEGKLLAGQSYVVCSGSLGELIATCDRTAGLTFNGDDAIALECDGAIVDVIGQIGFDPGTAWGTGELSLLDHTLRRSCDVTAGDADAADAFDPSGQWSGFGQDSFEDLGLRSCD